MSYARLVFGGALIYGLAMACGARSQLDAESSSANGAGGSAGATSGGGNAPDCAVFHSSANLAPLDVFVMMDGSGSMELLTSEGTQKWVAVRNALEAFFQEPESAGIGAAISFFPIIDPAVPEVCSNDMTCNLAGACEMVRVCVPLSGAACETDSDCTELNDTCEQLGYCAGAPVPDETFCVPLVGLECPQGTGPCLDYGFCENHFTCDTQPYATPVAGVATLPAGGSELLSAVDQHLYEGGTPTLPALSGALAGALSWGQSHADHKVIVVLATDGLPTVCDPALDSPDPSQAIDNLADAAAAGVVDGVNTFVIGVFSFDEQGQAQQNLDAIAAAGGTGHAYVISTSSNVTKEFLDALNEVRVIATSCEFALDLQSGGEPIDYNEVWVRVTDKQTGQQQWIPRVASANACDATKGGFYYDVAPGGPTAPSRIVLCPASCELLGAAIDRTIEIFTTCPDPSTG